MCASGRKTGSRLNGRFWRKAAIGQNIDVSEVPYADSLFPDFATSRLQNGTAARAR